MQRSAQSASDRPWVCRVDTEVDAKEARESGSGAEASLPCIKRPAGVQNVLSRILNKKQKLSVL
ncbi:unnamed protein product, partial [Ixodes pacificus]